MPKLVITVREIRGTCPVYKLGDRIVLDDGYRLNLNETDAVCMHSLASIMPYYNSLYNGVEPSKLGLANRSAPDECAYVQCLDPMHITDGGTVIFEIRRVD